MSATWGPWPGAVDDREATQRHKGLMPKADKVKLDAYPDFADFDLDPPSCLVRHSVAQSIANNTITTPAFDTEEYDTHAFHSTATNSGRLTIPSGRDGLYVAVLVAVFASANGEFQARIDNQAGTALARQRLVSGGATAHALTVVTPAQRMAAADYFEAKVFQVTGAAVNLSGGTSATYFSLHRIGGF